MKFLLLLSAFFLTSLVSSQTTTVEDGFEITYKKAVTNVRWLHSSSVYFVVPTKNQKRVQVRYRIQSTSGKREPFDPNKFYLLSDTYKARFQVVDMKFNALLYTYNTFGILANNREEGNEKKVGFINYSSNLKNSFKDYQKDGYEDILNCLNFGTTKKPRLECVYFDEKEIRSNIIDSYFIVPLDFYEGTVFYGDQKIADIKVK